MNPQLVRYSKFLSLVLRHYPQRIGLALDRGGWANVAELLAKANAANVPLTLDLLQQVVAENDKQRFAFSPDGTRIRASQGHSIPVDLGLMPLTPPDILYHGTATKYVASIRQQGLRPRQRQYVHLSGDVETAVMVGQRHGMPIVLTIQAGQMHRDGHIFYQSANGVWLTDCVPPDFIQFPKDPPNE